jgi:hypothetical protein
MLLPHRKTPRISSVKPNNPASKPVIRDLFDRPGVRTSSDARQKAADDLCRAAALASIAKAGAQPTPPSALFPLRHFKTGQPLIRQYYSINVEGVLHVRWAIPRHSTLDFLQLLLPGVGLRIDGLRILEGLGWTVRENFRRGTLTADYGPLHFTIRASRPGNLRDPRRAFGKYQWNLNPSWFCDITSVINLGRLLFDGFDPQDAVVGAIDCASDWGVPGDLFMTLQATSTKIAGATYRNSEGTTRGMYNGLHEGAGDDRFRMYDKRHHLMYRKPERRETLADVPWWRIEHCLKGAQVPIKALADLLSLAEFVPFGNREFRLAKIRPDKVKPTTPHWRTILKKLFQFWTIMERETQAQAVRALNGRGHFRRLVDQGYIELKPVAIDLAHDWREWVNGFCTSNGGPIEVDDYDLITENDCGYA